jgi:SAM-dependent methyltransferase
VRRRLASARVRVTFEVGDAEQLRAPDGAYATVVSTWLLCSVRDPAAVLREVRRVLRPGGHYLFVEHGLSGDRRQRRRQELLTPLTRITACGCTLTRPIPKLVSEAGFERVDLEEMDLPALGLASGHLFVGAASSSRG